MIIYNNNKTKQRNRSIVSEVDKDNINNINMMNKNLFVLTPKISSKNVKYINNNYINNYFNHQNNNNLTK